MRYMSAMQRRKGAVGEREASDALAAHGICAPRQARNGVDQGCDLAGDGLVVEVKRRHAISIDRWMQQADESRVRADDVPIMLCRADGGEWTLCVRLRNLTDFLAVVAAHRGQLMGAD